MDSGELVDSLRRRALSMLRSARLRIEWGDYDLACFDAEQAVQLRLKASLLRLFGEATRVHGVLEHLSLLRRRLAEAGFKTAADSLSDLVRAERELVELLDESYIMARYGSPGMYRKIDAERAVEFAERLLKALEKLEEAMLR